MKHTLTSPGKLPLFRKRLELFFFDPHKSYYQYHNAFYRYYPRYYQRGIGPSFSPLYELRRDIDVLRRNDPMGMTMIAAIGLADSIIEGLVTDIIAGDKRHVTEADFEKFYQEYFDVASDWPPKQIRFLVRQLRNARQHDFVRFKTTITRPKDYNYLLELISKLDPDFNHVGRKIVPIREAVLRFDIVWGEDHFAEILAARVSRGRVRATALINLPMYFDTLEKAIKKLKRRLIKDKVLQKHFNLNIHTADWLYPITK